MRDDVLISQVKTLLRDFLNGKEGAKSMIGKYNDIVANHLDWNSNDPKMKQIESFQDELANYEDDINARSEYPEFYGSGELLRKVREFVTRL